jgi:hypothetical protein
MDRSASRSNRRASEVGEFLYCQRAWWLHHVQGHEPANEAARARGLDAHAAHGALVRRAARLRRLALLVAFVGLVLLAWAVAR